MVRESSANRQLPTWADNGPGHKRVSEGVETAGLQFSIRQSTATPASYTPDKISLNNQSQLKNHPVHAVRIQAWAGINSIPRHHVQGAHQFAFRMRFQQEPRAPAWSAVSTHSSESSDVSISTLASGQTLRIARVASSPPIPGTPSTRCLASNPW
jgi:hypothetical protein